MPARRIHICEICRAQLSGNDVCVSRACPRSGHEYDFRRRYITEVHIRDSRDGDRVLETSYRHYAPGPSRSSRGGGGRHGGRRRRRSRADDDICVIF